MQSAPRSQRPPLCSPRPCSGQTPPSRSPRVTSPTLGSCTGASATRRSRDRCGVWPGPIVNCDCGGSRATWTAPSPASNRSAAWNVSTPSLAATRALAYAIAGRDAEAHRLANSLLSEPGGVPWNLTRPRALTDLAQVAGVLDAVDLARLIEPMLAPYDGELLCPANMLLTIDGAAATFLGIIDTVLGRWDRARQHVEAGLSLEEGFGAMGLAAITRIWRANLDHRQPDGHVGGQDADLAEASRAGEALGFGIAPLVARRLERDLPS